AAQVTGLLIDSAGKPAPQFYVMVFSTDKAMWLQGSRRLRPPVRPGTDGRFTIPGLPSGDYFIAALTEFDNADIYDAAFLEAIAKGAMKITLAEGEMKAQDLKLAGG